MLVTHRVLPLGATPIPCEGAVARPASVSNSAVVAGNLILATDAPLVASQLKRLARRVPLGLGRLGSYSGDGSGDIFIAFSTANPGAWGGGKVKHIDMLPNEEMNPLFIATVQCVEEAVVNAMVAAKDMKGINNFEVRAIPHAELQQVLKKYNRLVLQSEK